MATPNIYLKFNLLTAFTFIFCFSLLLAQSGDPCIDTGAYSSVEVNPDVDQNGEIDNICVFEPATIELLGMNPAYITRWETSPEDAIEILVSSDDYVQFQGLEVGTHEITAIIFTLRGDQGIEICRRTFNVTIEPSVGLEIGCPSAVCPGQTLTYEVLNDPLPCNSYLWTATGGTIVSDQGPASVRIEWDDVLPDQNYVGVSVEGVDCTPAICHKGHRTLAIISNNLEISGPDWILGNRICAYGYSAPIVPGGLYEWSIVSGDANIVGQITRSECTIRLNEEELACDSVVLQCVIDHPLLVCEGTLTKTIPVSFVTISPDSPGEGCNDEDLTIEFSSACQDISLEGIIDHNGVTVASIENGQATIPAGSTSPGIMSFTALFDQNPCALGLEYNIIENMDYTISGPDIFCENQVYTYTILPNKETSEMWDITGALNISNETNSSVDIEFDPQVPDHSVTLAPNSLLPCHSVNVLQPEKHSIVFPAGQIEGPDVVCHNSVAEFCFSVENLNTYVWDVNYPSNLGFTPAIPLPSNGPAYCVQIQFSDIGSLDPQTELIVEIILENECGGTSKSKLVTVTSEDFGGTITVDPEVVCMGHCTELEILPSPPSGATVEWQFNTQRQFDPIPNQTGNPVNFCPTINSTHEITASISFDMNNTEFYCSSSLSPSYLFIDNEYEPVIQLQPNCPAHLSASFVTLANPLDPITNPGWQYHLFFQDDIPGRSFPDECLDEMYSLGSGTFWTVFREGLYRLQAKSPEGCCYWSNVIEFQCPAGECDCESPVDITFSNKEIVCNTISVLSEISPWFPDIDDSVRPAILGEDRVTTPYWRLVNANGNLVKSERQVNGSAFTHEFEHAGIYRLSVSLSYFCPDIQIRRPEKNSQRTPEVPGEWCTYTEFIDFNIPVIPDISFRKVCTPTDAWIAQDVSDILEGYPLTQEWYSNGILVGTNIDEVILPDMPTNVLELRYTYFDDDGILQTCSKFVDLNEAPFEISVESSGNLACLGTPVQFSIEGTDVLNDVDRVQWDFGDGIVTNSLFPVFIFTEPGTHTVDVTVWFTGGGECSVTQSVDIEVGDAFDYTVLEEEFLSCGQFLKRVEVVILSNDGQDYTYEWSDGSSGSTNEFTENGYYDVTITNEFGCTEVNEFEIGNITDEIESPFDDLEACCTPNELIIVPIPQDYASTDFTFDLDLPTYNVSDIFINVVDNDNDGFYDNMQIQLDSCANNLGNHEDGLFSVFQNGELCHQYEFNILIEGDPVQPEIEIKDVKCHENRVVIHDINDNTVDLWRQAPPLMDIGEHISEIEVEIDNLVVFAINSTVCKTLVDNVSLDPPDLDFFLSGCYEFCEEFLPNEEEYFIPGVPGTADTWSYDLFNEDGSPIRNLISGTGIIDKYIIEPDDKGVIYLTVTWGDSCTWVSDPLKIDIYSCCEDVSFEVEEQLCLMSQDQIELTLNVDGVGGDDFELLLTSSNAVISSPTMNPYELDRGTNVIPVVLTGVSIPGPVDLIAQVLSPEGVEVPGCSDSVSLDVSTCGTCEDIDFNVEIQNMHYANGEVVIDAVLHYYGPFSNLEYIVETIGGDIYSEGVIASGSSVSFTMIGDPDEQGTGCFEYSVSFFSVPYSNTDIDCCFDFCQEVFPNEVLTIVDCHDQNPSIPDCPSTVCDDGNAVLHVIAQETGDIIDDNTFIVEWDNGYVGNPITLNNGYFLNNDEICVCLKINATSACFFESCYRPDCCKTAPEIVCENFGGLPYFSWAPSVGGFDPGPFFDIEIMATTNCPEPICTTSVAIPLNQSWIFPWNQYGIGISDIAGELGLPMNPVCFKMRVRRVNCGENEDEWGEWSEWFDYCGPMSCGELPRPPSGTNGQSTVSTEDHRPTEAAFVVQPNPFENTIRVLFREAKTRCTISLLDIRGATLFEDSFEQIDQVEINTDRFAAGSYLLVVKDEVTGVKVYQKVLKVRK